ncbi:efflux RND transporter permease subunit [Sphingopyxis yananensis]|uniref:efflux RND transporter permease subunit n=1 Tax=Sphingopyxis yananensis TaxID=2886687 RepID=UPI001D116BE2|nr:efflux RND transporter permease subunit [Sphingopyxis yananensis]MCC2602446.1 efflux RND transporter permease subunit [Sphingopyxis yananensis]
MDLRNISAWSIRNPVPPIVVFLLLMLAGIVSFNRMDINDMPDVEFPMVIVEVAQPGAAPSELENQISQRIEAAVRAVNGVDEISSIVSEGSSRTMVQFAIGMPIDRAYNDVNQAVSQIRGDLPDGILEPRVYRVDAVGGPISYFSVEASDMTLEQLSWFVDNTVAKELLSVNGMASVTRSGGVSREIRVQMDPARMQSYGLTASQVNQQLQQINLNAAGGRTEIAGSEQAVRVLGNAGSAVELAETRISLGQGRTIRLGDIADVSDAYAEQRAMAKMNQRQVLAFAITKAKGASDVAVHDEAVLKLEQLAANNPKVKFGTLFTMTEYIKEQYDSAMLMMVEGAILAVVVVFLFLRDWRATAISALAIPLSAIPTFFFMDLMGFSLNSLSLLALSLVAGVLVDDAIVEIENIVRHMRMGKSAFQASIDAADEIGLAVVATTMSIVAVFLPVALMPGISGQFFIQFGMTIVFAVLISLAVARMITPMIAAYFLAAQGEDKHGEGPAIDRYERVLAWTLNSNGHRRRRAHAVPAAFRPTFWIVPLLVGVAALAWQFSKFVAPVGPGIAPPSAAVFYLVIGPLSLIMASLIAMLLMIVLGSLAYKLGVKNNGFAQWAYFMAQRFWARLFDHRVWVLGAGVVALLLTLVIFTQVPQQFQPTMNSNNSEVVWELPPGTTLAQSEGIAEAIDAALKTSPDVESVMLDINIGSGSGYVTLKRDRKMKSVEWEQQMLSKLTEIPDARISFRSQSHGFSSRDITLAIGGDDPAELELYAQKIVAEMSELKEIRAPRIEGDTPRPEILVKPRMDLAADLGVTTAALSQTIRIATLGDIDQNAAKFSLSDRQIPIRVLLAEDSRRSLATIENLPVPTSRGTTVPLKSVAEISFGVGPTQIRRYNQTRRVVVGADLAPGVKAGVAQAKIDALPSIAKMPDGIRKIVQGDQKFQLELISNFAIAVVSGLMMVFATLVLLYRRFLSPLVNMTSLLLAPFGGLLALWLTGQPISMPVYIGLLMLLGIVAKNSILLVDFALEEMERGVPKTEALLDAGRKRAQPIVMTTVAMVAGMVPTALSLSGDGAWRAPMGIVVIGGLIVSTLLTLVIVPAGFSIADSLERRLGRYLGSRLLTYREGDDQPNPNIGPHGPSSGHVSAG